MSFFRNTVWFARGLQYYTKGGYESASKHFDPSDLQVDCTGKSYMITGANSGIGKCMALDIAKRGGKVHLVCRNQKTGCEAQKEIQEASGNKDIFLHLLDLSDSDNVVKFAQDFVASENLLDVLINNAGCMVNEKQINAHGLEKNFATNTLGTHLLTTCLIPLLSKSPEARVVIVSSGGMLVQKLNVADIQLDKEKKFDGTMVYAQNKRQQVVMTEQYAKRYPNIHFSAMHPGWADTPAVRSSMPEFYEKMKNRLRTADQGADTATWLAISHAAIKHSSGLFYEDRRPVPTHLPLAWTRTSEAEDAEFMSKLDSIASKFLHQ